MARVKAPLKSRKSAARTSDAFPADQALDLVMRLMAVPGKSGEEGRVVELIRKELKSAGAEMSHVRLDDTPKRSPLGGEVGNLVFTLPGTLPGPRRMLMAHMDTVPLCVGSRPVRKGAFVHSADKSTGLGADDRAGCAVLLNTAVEILRRRLPHPPLTFFWPVQEEVGLFGAHHGDLSLLGKPKLAFNWDGGPAEKLTIGATVPFGCRLPFTASPRMRVTARKKVGAVTIASLAIADLHNAGWLGLIMRDGTRGTSNVGVVQGGAATNVITDRVDLRAECRSHDPKFRKEVLKAFQVAFEKAAASVSSTAGKSGKVKFESRLDYDSFLLAADEPCVLEAEKAVAAVGLTPIRAVSNGGLDANWLSARGIPTVTLGCGQQNVHTVSEQLDVQAFLNACRIGLKLATPSASS